MKHMHYPCPRCGNVIKINIPDMARGFSERLEYMICPGCGEEIPFPIRTEPVLDFPMWAPDKLKEPTPLNAFDMQISRWSSSTVVIAALGFLLYGANGLVSGKAFTDVRMYFAAAAVFALIAVLDWAKTFSKLKADYEIKKELYERSAERLNIEEYSKALRTMDIDVPAEYFSAQEETDVNISE